MQLWRDFQTNAGRTIHKWNQYFPAYERHFSPFIGRPVTFLEIGCGDGGSIQMWKRFFGPYARLIGADIRPACQAFEDEQTAIRIGDQSDPAFLQSIVDEFGVPDLVLDDGSHMMAHVSATFSFLYPKMRGTGVYMVEDLHTAYWEEFGGGYRSEGSFIERAKHLVDEVHAEFSRGGVADTDLSRHTNSIHFYKSVIVFERGLNIPSTPTMTGSTGHYADPS